jgi:hypothetical protein
MLQKCDELYSSWNEFQINTCNFVVAKTWWIWYKTRALLHANWKCNKIGYMFCCFAEKVRGLQQNLTLKKRKNNSWQSKVLEFLNSNSKPYNIHT